MRNDFVLPYIVLQLACQLALEDCAAFLAYLYAAAWEVEELPLLVSIAEVKLNLLQGLEVLVSDFLVVEYLVAQLAVEGPLLCPVSDKGSDILAIHLAG